MPPDAPPTPIVPSRIETPRFLLRPYELTDGPALHAAVNASLAELRPWLPWTDWHPDVAASTETCSGNTEAGFWRRSPEPAETSSEAPPAPSRGNEFT